MPWFKVDDTLYSHPKWLATSLAARGLWVTAGSWCSSHLTDGRVPRHVLPILGGRARDAAELVAAGLWSATDDGWVFHDWLDLQPSSEQVAAERASARERQRRARDKARESRRDIDRDSQGSHSGSHGPPDPTRPDPTSRVDPPAAATGTPAERRERLAAAARIIGERAAQRPGVRDPQATAAAVARGIQRDRHQDAYRHLAAVPTATAQELADFLEPGHPADRPVVLPPSSAPETIADFDRPAPPPLEPDQQQANLAAVRQLRPRPPEPAA